jgi:integrase
VSSDEGHRPDEMTTGDATISQGTREPTKAPKRAVRRGLGWIHQRGHTWWIQYSWRGEVHRESSGSTDRRDALKLLRRRLAEIGQGRLVGPDVERTTYEQLDQGLVDDYQMNGRKSLGRMKTALAHLRHFFRLYRAVEITTDRITTYVVKRQEAGAAAATVNRELAALKRAFRLAKRAGRVVDLPYIPMLTENNTRKGFFGIGEFRGVITHLPDDLQPAFETAYVAGWRVRSELLTRQKLHVDLQHGWLRLEPGETKNGDGRVFPLTPELRAILERQLARTSKVEREIGEVIPWLFHRDGKPIKVFRRAWITACKKAGVPERIPHDLRRTAVRNLERAGVPRSAAMKMVGHKTESIYRRYAIADEAMLREGAAKLSALHQAEQAQPATIRPIALRQRTGTSDRSAGQIADPRRLPDGRTYSS